MRTYYEPVVRVAGFRQNTHAERIEATPPKKREWEEVLRTSQLSLRDNIKMQKYHQRDADLLQAMTYDPDELEKKINQISITFNVSRRKAYILMLERRMSPEI